MKERRISVSLLLNCAAASEDNSTKIPHCPKVRPRVIFYNYKYKETLVNQCFGKQAEMLIKLTEKRTKKNNDTDLF